MSGYCSHQMLSDHCVICAAYLPDGTPRKGHAERLEELRAAAQIAERHESEMRAKLGETAKRYACGSRTQAELAEMAECYVAVKRACQNAQERYREAIRTN